MRTNTVNSKRIRKIAMTGLLLSMSLIIGIIEHSLPPIIPVLPYLKLGLGNVVILATYILLGYKSALVVMLLKCVGIAIFSGNPISLAFSVSAGTISLCISMLLLHKDNFSLIAVSALSAMIHNLVQILVAWAVMGTWVVLSYLPYMFVLGSIAGVFTGLIATLVIRYLPNSTLRNIEN